MVSDSIAIGIVWSGLMDMRSGGSISIGGLSRSLAMGVVDAISVGVVRAGLGHIGVAAITIRSLSLPLAITMDVIAITIMGIVVAMGMGNGDPHTGGTMAISSLGISIGLSISLGLSLSLPLVQTLGAPVGVAGSTIGVVGNGRTISIAGLCSYTAGNGKNLNNMQIERE